MVTTRPVPSVSIAPPSRIQSGLSTAQPGVCGQLGADRLVAVHQVLAAPAVEAEAPREALAVAPNTTSGPVSRSQMSP